MTTAARRGRRRWCTGVAAIAVALVACGGGDGDDGGDDGATATTPPSATSAVEATTTTAAAQGPVAATPDGAELVALVEQGQSASYTARYRTVDASTTLGEVQVDVWRDGDRLRQDARVQIDGREVLSSAFVSGERVRACQRDSLAPDWQCRDVPRDQAADVDAQIRSVVSRLSGQATGGRDETIAGQPSRCYDVADEDEAVALCVTTTGVPARFIAGDSTIELLSFRAGVPDGVFEPPA